MLIAGRHHPIASHCGRQLAVDPFAVQMVWRRVYVSSESGKPQWLNGICVACRRDLAGAVRRIGPPSLTIVATACDSAYTRSRKQHFRIAALLEQ
jgi:hypothetical protein